MSRRSGPRLAQAFAVALSRPKVALAIASFSSRCSRRSDDHPCGPAAGSGIVSATLAVARNITWLRSTRRRVVVTEEWFCAGRAPPATPPKGRSPVAPTLSTRESDHGSVCRHRAAPDQRRAYTDVHTPVTADLSPRRRTPPATCDEKNSRPVARAIDSPIDVCRCGGPISVRMAPTWGRPDASVLAQLRTARYSVTRS